MDQIPVTQKIGHSRRRISACLRDRLSRSRRHRQMDQLLQHRAAPFGARRTDTGQGPSGPGPGRGGMINRQAWLRRKSVRKTETTSVRPTNGDRRRPLFHGAHPHGEPQRPDRAGGADPSRPARRTALGLIHRHAPGSTRRLTLGVDNPAARPHSTGHRHRQSDPPPRAKQVHAFAPRYPSEGHQIKKRR